MTDSPMTAPDCNCNPDDYPPVPCQHKRSYSECMRAALASAQADNKELRDALEDLLGQCIQGAAFHEITINSPSTQEAINTARAALAKTQAEIVALKRPGYVSVPVEPTEDMVAPGEALLQGVIECVQEFKVIDAFATTREIYKAMLAASGEGKP